MASAADYLYRLPNGLTALVVMATENEYGDALKAMGIKPFITGVGPVQAASGLTHLLSQIQHLSSRHMPDVIINLGSAGSATLEQGKVYQVIAASYRDMDASAFGFAKGQTPFSPLPAAINLAPIPVDISIATCSTGANVVADHSAHQNHMAEMEFSAFLDVGMKFGIPVIGLKGISDGKKPLSGDLKSWTELLPEIDRNLAEAIKKIERGLEEGTLDKKTLCRMPAEWKPEFATFREGRGRAG